MGIDGSTPYVDVLKRRLNSKNDPPSKTAESNQEGDRCPTVALPSKKVTTAASPPSAMVPEQQPADAPEAAPMAPPVEPKAEDVEKADVRDLDINFNKISLAEEKELPPEKMAMFPFFLPKALCGKLIGRNGWSRKDIKDKTEVDVNVLKDVCMINEEECQLVQLVGPERTMEKAIQMVRNKFPERKYPLVKLDVARHPIRSTEIHLPETQILVQISCVTNPGLIYVMQPEHWSYCSFASFQCYMTAFYHENPSPRVTDPLPGDIYVSLGPVCHRVTVVEVPNEEEVLVRYLDMGGIYVIPIDCLRPMREEFVSTPFQATECAMAGIVENGPGWSNAAFNYLSSWCQQIIHGIVSYVGLCPYIQLFGKLPNGAMVCINEQMMLLNDMAPVGNAVLLPQQGPMFGMLHQEGVGGDVMPVAEAAPEGTETAPESTEAAPEGTETAPESTETAPESAETTEGGKAEEERDTQLEATTETSAEKADVGEEDSNPTATTVSATAV